MKNTALSLLLLAPVPGFAEADSSYECISSKNERVLIEVLNEGLSMTVEGTGNVTEKSAERHVFPFLNPFLEVAGGKLRSLTHVADMTSYSLEHGQSDFMFPYVHLTLELNDPGPSLVKWRILQFGASNNFEVSCDVKGLWSTIHQTTL